MGGSCLAGWEKFSTLWATNILGWKIHYQSWLYSNHPCEVCQRLYPFDHCLVSLKIHILWSCRLRKEIAATAATVVVGTCARQKLVGGQVLALVHGFSKNILRLWRFQLEKLRKSWWLSSNNHKSTTIALRTVFNFKPTQPADHLLQKLVWTTDQAWALLQSTHWGTTVDS